MPLEPLTGPVVRRFNVYVTQPEVKPGCVLRRSNWSVLEGRSLVDNDQVRVPPQLARAALRQLVCTGLVHHRAAAPAAQVSDCKRHMNTFAFVGDLEGA